MIASPAFNQLSSRPSEVLRLRTSTPSSANRPETEAKARADQIRRVLNHAGFTVIQISEQTRRRYGGRSHCLIPPTFLYKQARGITPHICQILALSEVTGFSFADWMRLFGFDLRWIFPLQRKLHTERTVMVTPDLNFSRPAVRELEPSSFRERYLFASIGRRDAILHPRLPPGSIVRVDQTFRKIPVDSSAWDKRLWLVEHAGGLLCCFVTRVDPENIVLLPTSPRLTPWPLRLGQEAEVLGMVDSILRSRQTIAYEPLPSLAKTGLLPGKRQASAPRSLQTLLRVSRSRAGLTLRAAHRMTTEIARILADPDYGIALGLLSDYEASDELPRHVAKIFSLCVIYGIHPRRLMSAAGFAIEESNKRSLFDVDGGSRLPLSA